MITFMETSGGKNLYINLIGTGKKNPGSRLPVGNLTQYYHSENDVIGVDVDRNALLEFEKRLGLKVNGSMLIQSNSLLMTIISIQLFFLKLWSTFVSLKKLSMKF